MDIFIDLFSESQILLSIKLSSLVLCLFFIWKTRKRFQKMSAFNEQSQETEERSQRHLRRDQIQKSSLHARNLSNTKSCTQHTERESTGQCHICQKTYCEECLKLFSFSDDHKDGPEFSLCPLHQQLYSHGEWIEAATLMSTPDAPENSKALHLLKTDLWQNEDIPTILSTQYKINFENNKIETYDHFRVRKKDLKRSLFHLKNLSLKHSSQAQNLQQ